MIEQPYLKVVVYFSKKKEIEEKKNLTVYYDSMWYDWFCSFINLLSHRSCQILFKCQLKKISGILVGWLAVAHLMLPAGCQVVLYLVFHPPLTTVYKKIEFLLKPKEQRLNCPSFLADAIFEEHHSIRWIQKKTWAHESVVAFSEMSFILWL